MAKFAKAEKQAAKAIREKLAIASSRHGNRNSGKIHSIGTARSYAAALTKVTVWMKDCRFDHGLAKLTPAEAWRFLADQAVSVKQSTLDQYRQAVECHLGVKFERIHSERETVLDGRAYTVEQTKAIAEAQMGHNAIATDIASQAGLRAHELHTIRPIEEQHPSPHRTWAENLFAGRENWERYTVVGKGGLIREVRLSPELSGRLEAIRLAEPVTVRDRDIFYEKHYSIGGGNAWSKSVTVASKEVLGFSNGAHGFRHSYAQDRMDDYQSMGFSYQEALANVAQELGHFSPHTTEVYLR